MEQQDAIHAEYHRIFCWIGKYLEIPIPMSTKWRRSVPHPLHGDVNPRRNPSVSHRARNRSEDETWISWSVEYYSSLAGRCWDIQLFGDVFCRSVLQCYYYMVFLLPVQFFLEFITLGFVPQVSKWYHYRRM
uniref:Uncharacterized protein n=1 Tax=Cacopsylla melanoneura TaxID=428564 RepID=A0A8D9A8W4_9HEMI